MRFADAVGHTALTPLLPLRSLHTGRSAKSFARSRPARPPDRGADLSREDLPCTSETSRNKHHIPSLDEFVFHWYC